MRNSRSANVGDYVQVDNEECYFDQCFMYVDEVKSWGVLAGMYLPEKGWGSVWCMGH